MENKVNVAASVNNSNVVAGNGAVVEAVNSAANQTVKTFALTVKRVQTIETDDSFVSVNLTFDKTIPGFVKSEDGSFVEADVNNISFTRSKITKQLCAINDLIATYRDSCEEPFNRKQFSIILHGAKINIKRTLHAAGEIVNDGDEPLERDKWYTDIVGVGLSKTASALLLSALTLS